MSPLIGAHSVIPARFGRADRLGVASQRLRLACTLFVLVVSLSLAGNTRVNAGRQGDQFQNTVALGITISLGSETVFSNPGLLDAYASLTGRMPAIVNVGSDWEHYPEFNATVMGAIRSRGGMPMWTWLPDNYNLAGYQPGFKLTTIASGAYDDYIRRFAMDAKNWGFPFLLRFAHEMNATWYPWSTGTGNANGNSPSDYIAAWRHVHDIFTSVGASNVLWVWCVNTESPSATPIAQDYPGDAYVDWVAMDGYNFGSTVPNGQWLSLAQVFLPTYQDISRLTSKPLMISELSSAEQGGDKAAWITDGLLSALPSLLPRVRAVLWFDAVDGYDWRVDTSTASLTAFRQVVASPMFQSTFDPFVVDDAPVPAAPQALPTIVVAHGPPPPPARKPVRGSRTARRTFRWGSPRSPIPS